MVGRSPSRSEGLAAAVVLGLIGAGLLFLLVYGLIDIRRVVPEAPPVTPVVAEPAMKLHPLDLPLVNPRIEISKGKRRLALYASGKPVRVYRVGLGADPVNDKTCEGDGCTPEGAFYICMKNPQSTYHLSLGISYPNAEDAARGLAAGMITTAQHTAIIEAAGNHGQPPWNTPLGGEICIHGHGSVSDWTQGCIALENSDIEELYAAVPAGTPVIITP